jgi:hypothetical protein
MSEEEPAASGGDEAQVSSTHYRVGWWALLAYLSLGIVLESMHGFKIRWYLDVSNETRRLMWTLAHTHGTLLSILNIVFASTVRQMSGWQGGGRKLASRCFIAALILLPLGFFFGGIFIHGGDPGLGVLLVPPGALVLLIAVFLTARATSRTVSS